MNYFKKLFSEKLKKHRKTNHINKTHLNAFVLCPVKRDTMRSFLRFLRKNPARLKFSRAGDR
ncbi:hypothetical protein Cst_c23740 [Thermoclostridium stercorarium subsp. stercorarium DSM 8532]|uniref:Uncharacterized protein n=1 Tax=Thermoclostridium stercorarium (strain ATCC 35414 / DSM 8532 / NCIMB 11754) TaxID=1121335 RepID=L7VRR1_THES1|nr:hypothetical protein Cst_c23740 [Thermoclostridium stercorarium subsp. stercorarium DSM 8532]